jgi:hypothetical protein
MGDMVPFCFYRKDTGGLIEVQGERWGVNPAATYTNTAKVLRYAGPSDTVCRATSCAERNDAMTGLESRFLEAEEYRRQLLEVGLSVTSEYEDEGWNHYFDAFNTDINKSGPTKKA